MALARKAARAHDHVRALNGPGARSPEVLYDLAMYRAAAETAAAGARRSDRWILAVALAQQGDCEEAIAVARPIAKSIGGARRRALALALARWEPRAGLEWLPAGAHLERAAICLRLDDLAGAESSLAATSDLPDRSNFHALAASLAMRRHDNRRARAFGNAMFQTFGLSAPFDEAVAEPPSLDGFRPADAKTARGPLVSVIMPARNAGTTIVAAIRSIVRQSWTTTELIVIDDGSSDGTADLVEASAKDDARIRLIRLEMQNGAYAARNVGLTEARGDFVTFADADDVAHPERVATAARALLRNRPAVAHLSRLVRLHAENGFVSPRIFPLIRRNPSSLMFRRCAVLARLGFFEPVATGADSEYIGRIVAAFGRTALLMSRDLFVVADSSERSLTGAPATGLAGKEVNRARLAYWEDWHWRHARVALRSDPNARPWYMPASAADGMETP